MTHSDALRHKAARFHLIAESLRDGDASSLHEAAAILEQQADVEEARMAISTRIAGRQPTGDGR